LFVDWYDMIGLTTPGTCMNIRERFQITTSDKQFIKDVLAGLSNGEQWYVLGLVIYS